MKVPALAVTLGLICVVSLTGTGESAWLLMGFGAPAACLPSAPTRPSPEKRLYL